MIRVGTMKIKKIAIISHEKILYINVYEIVCCQSEGTYVSVQLADGTKHIIHKQLMKLQSLLPPFFVRVTQCVIINKLYLHCIDKKEKLIRLHGGPDIKFTLPLGKLLSRIGEISTEEQTPGLNGNEEGEVFLESA